MIRVDGQCAGAWIAYPGCKGVMLDPSTRLVDFEPGNAQLCKNRDSGVGGRGAKYARLWSRWLLLALESGITSG